MATPSLQSNGGRSLQPPFESDKRRDGALFPLRRGPEQQEFFTDSLEFSQIPTPSPPKSGAAVARPRRAVRNLRADELGLGHEKERRSSSSSSSRTRHPDDNLRPYPSQSARRSRIPTPSGQSTPSPARGRPLDLFLQSPNSDSSPPRGLAEAYQRIDEEENLTAQEGEIREEPEDETLPEDTFEQHSIDRLRLEKIRSTSSPKSRSPSLIPRRSTSRLDLIASTGNKENIREEDTQTTDASGMSFLEDVTDDSLRKKLHDHAMDKQRLDRALKRESPAFNARSNRTPRLTAENLQRRSDAYGGQSEKSETPNTSISETSEIPLNVPKSWGSSGRASKDWLSKINNRKVLNSPTSQSYNGCSEVDWVAAAADVPIPSVENSSSPPPLPSQGSTPTGMVMKHPSLDRVREWELDADFTARSLQVSNSPPVRLRSNALDEIEDLEKKAVTTNQLREIYKRSSDELLRKRSPTPKIDQERPSSRKSTSSTNSDAQDEQADEQVFEEVLPIKEGSNGVSDALVVVHKSPDSFEIKEQSHHSSNGSNVTIKGEKAAEPELHDSQELLRRLARATSASPAPPVENWTLVDEEGNSQNQGSAKDEKENKIGDDRAIDITQAPSKPEKHPKTPVVTGAWIDTPLPTKRPVTPAEEVPKSSVPEDLTNGIEETVTRPKSQRPLESTSAKTEFDTLSHTSLPKSALEKVIDGVKNRKDRDRQNESLVITDDTVQSLEELLGLSEEEMSTLLFKFPQTDPNMAIEDDILDTRPKPERERDHLAQMALYSRLNNRLHLLRHSIHDAKNGISKLEHQVSTTDTADETQILPRCLDCGCPSNSTLTVYAAPYPTRNALYIPLYLPTPRLWRRVSNRRLPRPTRLGWLLFVVWLWCITEAYLAYWYSPHFSGNPFDPPQWFIGPKAPVYPYVTVTKLYEWSGLMDIPNFIRPIWNLTRMIVVASVRLLAQMFGWGDGFVGDGGPGSVPVSMDSRIPRPEYAPDLSMNGDEYL